MDLNQIIAISVISVIGITLIFIFIKAENKRFNSLDKHNETVINQYTELMAHEKENNLRQSPPPTVTIIKGGYALFLPSEEQSKHFKQN